VIGSEKDKTRVADPKVISKRTYRVSPEFAFVPPVGIAALVTPAFTLAVAVLPGVAQSGSPYGGAMVL
jgi:hypothetical protein